MIRPEQSADIAAIDAVNRAAFDSDVEARLVEALRASGHVIASIVAVEDGRIVGHVLFSRVWIDSETGSVPIASLAPMAVLPDRQGKGIGAALVREGIAMCVHEGWPAVIVVGHPAYYPRFGFSAAAVVHLKSPYAGNAFMGLDIRPRFLASANGVIRYPAAFANL